MKHLEPVLLIDPVALTCPVCVLNYTQEECIAYPCHQLTLKGVVPIIEFVEVTDETH
jgi:hypothetical protein